VPVELLTADQSTFWGKLPIWAAGLQPTPQGHKSQLAPLQVRLIDGVAHPLAAWPVNKINHLISTLGTRPLTGSLSF
jgi:hypothetical protein